MSILNKEDNAVFDGRDLTAIFHYYWPESHDEGMRFSVTEPSNADCVYWAAVKGKCYAFTGPGNSCIASLQKALGMALEAGGVYVIFKPKMHSQSAWERWSKKWSEKTKS